MLYSFLLSLTFAGESTVELDLLEKDLQSALTRLQKIKNEDKGELKGTSEYLQLSEEKIKQHNKDIKKEREDYISDKNASREFVEERKKKQKIGEILDQYSLEKFKAITGNKASIKQKFHKMFNDFIETSKEVYTDKMIQKREKEIRDLAGQKNIGDLSEREKTPQLPLNTNVQKVTASWENVPVGPKKNDVKALVQQKDPDENNVQEKNLIKPIIKENEKKTVEAQKMDPKKILDSYPEENIEALKKNKPKLKKLYELFVKDTKGLENDETVQSIKQKFIDAGIIA